MFDDTLNYLIQFNFCSIRKNSGKKTFTRKLKNS